MHTQRALHYETEIFGMMSRRTDKKKQKQRSG
jgi:hypothetical protein